MTSEYTGELTAQEREAANQSKTKANRAGAALAEKPLVEVPAEVLGHRSFVAAQEWANSKFLVKTTGAVKMPLGGGNPSSGVTPLSHREGDLFVEFVDGVVTTADPEIIAWCEKNIRICRPASDPRTRAWAKIKEAQTPMANREATMDDDVDPDELLFGANRGEALGAAVSKGRADDVVTGAQDAAKKADEDAARVQTPGIGH